MSVKSQFAWTWIGGTGTSSNLSPVFGTQGVANSSNNPGARYASVTWTDASGNLWLFGGYNSSLGYMADLWKYSPSTGLWTWMKGPSSAYAYGVYGTQGVANANNYPGCRYCAGGWADNNGNLYLFGGYGHSNTSYSYNNDLWVYNIASNNWTWLKGSSSGYGYGTYGTLGTGASANTPGCRYMCPMTRDQNGNGWLYGGYGYSSNSGAAPNNDLWKFDVSTGNWVWMGGSSTSQNINPIYGTQGVASSTNYPGSKEETNMCSDNNGNLYIFGGYGTSSSGNGLTNDLWRYNISTGQWTWLKGSNSTYVYGVYGTLGTAAANNAPGSRYQYTSNTLMADGGGNLWMFGSYGYSSNNNGLLNDLWRFNLTTSQWTWMSGSNGPSANATYGTINVSSTNNTPGARENPVGFSTPGAFYIYGGYGYGNPANGTMNDFFRYDICNYGTPPANTTATANLSVCSGNTTTLTVNTASGTTIWYPSPTGTNSIGTGTSVVVSGSLLANAGTTATTALIYVTNSVSCGENMSRQAISVTVNPRPAITVNNGTLCEGAVFVMSPSGAQSYTYSNGSNTVIATTSQAYTVTGSNSFGCTNALPVTASLSVIPSPSVVVNSGSICAGGSFVIVPTGAVSYTISGGSTTVSPQSSTGYFVTGTSSLGCTSASPAIASVMVYALPNISVNNATICAGTSYTLNPTGAATYTYSSGNGVVSPSVSTVYGITGTSQYGCVSNNTVLAFVNVNPQPNIAISNAIICSGQSVTFQPQGAASYTYSSGSNVVTPSTTTTYSVTGTTGAGCVNLVPALVTVSVNTKPVLVVNSGSMCSGTSYTISPTGAATYTYYSGGPIVSPANSSTYMIAGTSSAGCTSSVTPVVVTVLQSPNIVVPNGMICAGESHTFNPSGANTYTISGGSIVVTPSVSSQYTITGTATNGCNGLTPVIASVIVNALPALSGSAFNPTICAGESATLVASGASSYSWTGNSGGQMTSVGFAVVTPTATSVYTVTGYSNEGCESSATITQFVSECAGLSLNQLEGVSVYPNPNNGVFMVNTPVNANYVILNAAGQLIKEGQTSLGANAIDLQSYSNGLYFVRIQFNQQSAVIKIVKQ